MDRGLWSSIILRPLLFLARFSAFLSLLLLLFLLLFFLFLLLSFLCHLLKLLIVYFYCAVGTHIYLYQCIFRHLILYVIHVHFKGREGSLFVDTVLVSANPVTFATQDVLLSAPSQPYARVKLALVYRLGD